MIWLDKYSREGVLSIAFGSINTGLPKDIVQQLMKAERIPIERMEVRKEKFGSKRQLVQQLADLMKDLKGHLTRHGSSSKLKEYKASFNDSIVEMTVDRNVVFPGSYQLQVERLAQKSSAMTSGVEDPDESYLGVGRIRYSLPDGQEKELYVDSGNSSLRGVARLINASDGMRASVIDDGSGSETPWRLIISLEDTGDGHRAEFPYFYFIDGDYDFFVEFERKAHDALVYFDGFEIEQPGNKISNLIPGVTIDLKKAAPGEEFTIGIKEDIKLISDKIKEMVSKINSILGFITQQNNMDEKTDTSRTLGGDILLQTIEGRLRRLIFQDIPTDFGLRKIGHLGVSFLRTGQLDFDQEKFEATTAENYKLTEQILTGKLTEEGKTKGFMNRLSELIDHGLRAPDGAFYNRLQGLKSNMDDIDRKINQKERLLEQKERALKDKYARLESTISKIKNSAAGLSALGGGGTPNPVQNLGG